METYLKTATGAVKSIPDYRDAIASTAALPVSTFSLPETFETVLDTPMMQAQEPACVSHSAVEVLKLYYFQKTGKWIEFSPRFLDTLAKRFDGQDRATGGTDPRLVFKLMAQYGCATVDMLPNDTSLPVLQYREDALLTPAVFANAAQYKIPGYVAIPMDFQSTRQAISLYGAISALFAVGDTFWIAADGTTTWDDAKIDPLRIPNQVTSGHELTLKGWTGSTYNTLRNEWSAAWANNGEANYDPIAWSPFIYEQWAIAEIPQDVKDFIANLPSPVNFHYTWNTNLSEGEQNDDVKFAQVALMILGFLQLLDPSELGIFGPKTAAANLKYQIAKGISPTSAANIGPQTRAALNAQFSI